MLVKRLLMLELNLHTENLCMLYILDTQLGLGDMNDQPLPVSAPQYYFSSAYKLCCQVILALLAAQSFLVPYTSSALCTFNQYSHTIEVRVLASRWAHAH
jgi:hypothetical protein